MPVAEVTLDEEFPRPREEPKHAVPASQRSPVQRAEEHHVFPWAHGCFELIELLRPRNGQEIPSMIVRDFGAEWPAAG